MQSSGSGGPLSVISTFSVDAYTVAYREASFSCSETKRRLACLTDSGIIVGGLRTEDSKGNASVLACQSEALEQTVE